MGQFFLSIDNGGTATKVVIFDELGQQLASSSFPTLRIERENGQREVDLNDLWEAICQAVNAALKQANLSGKDIICVSCVGHGKGLYLLDKQSNIFHPGILSTDERGVQLAAAFEKEIDRIWPISQQHIVPSQSPVLLRWLKDNDPTTFEQIGHVLSAKDFLRFMLTDTINQEYGDASGNNFLHLEQKSYNQQLLEFFGISEIKSALPKLVNCSEIVGTVTKKAAKQTGLLEGTPVVGGLFDIDACALASGVLKEQHFSVVAGTWSINCYPSKKAAGKSSGLMNSLFPDGQYLVEASSPTSAGNLEQMIGKLLSEERKNAQQSGGDIYPLLEDFLTHTDAEFNKVLYFPFLYGSNVGEEAKACFIGLTTTTTKSEMIRAVYEGVAFAHLDHIEQLIATLGQSPTVIRVSGGATNSDQWMQLFADVFQQPVETIQATELGGLGGAIVSLVGMKQVDNLEEAVMQMVHVNKRFEPNKREGTFYRKKYKVYKHTLQQLAPLWKELVEI